MLFVGLLIRLLGVGLMIHARGPKGNTASLVICQILQGIGGGFAAIALQVSAQAAVSHVDVATVTAMVLLITEVGNSVGSAIATGIWTSFMPGELKAHVPTNNATLLAELFGSITDISLYPVGSPIRVGAIVAYQNVMYVAFIPHAVLSADHRALLKVQACPRLSDRLDLPTDLLPPIHQGRPPHPGTERCGREGSRWETDG